MAPDARVFSPCSHLAACTPQRKTPRTLAGMDAAVAPSVRAVCERHGAAVDLVMARIYGFLDISTQWDVTMAALCGHLRLVQRISARHPRPYEGCCTEAMDSAAEFGHLEVVQWLHANRREGCTTDAMDMAASNGHLEIVQWLHANRKEGCTKSAMDFAAQHGHLDIVKWLHKNRPEGCTKLAVDNAAKEGHLEIVRWLHEHREEGCSRSAFTNACAEGHIEVVKWLLSHRPQNCSVAEGMDKAQAYGHTAIEAWLEQVDFEGCDELRNSDEETEDTEDELWMSELLDAGSAAEGRLSPRQAAGLWWNVLSVR